jgi:hypothetical protein
MRAIVVKAKTTRRLWSPSKEEFVIYTHPEDKYNNLCEYTYQEET